MTTSDTKQGRLAAAAALEAHTQRADSVQLVNSLCDGLTVVRESFFSRIHLDVENILGADSMMIPVAVFRFEELTLAEIDVYLVAESVTQLADGGYIADKRWYGDWLCDLRLQGAAGDKPPAERLSSYLAKSHDDRRRSFSLVVERNFPEARRAPLIVYRLLPLAAAIVTSLAFGDTPRAAENARRKQTQWLPHISDCHECHGRLLDNGEKCPQCGNPFWNFDWLTAE